MGAPWGQERYSARCARPPLFTGPMRRNAHITGNGGLESVRVEQQVARAVADRAVESIQETGSTHAFGDMLALHEKDAQGGYVCWGFKKVACRGP
jgi:hypothetical protein